MDTRKYSFFKNLSGMRTLIVTEPSTSGTRVEVLIDRPQGSPPLFPEEFQLVCTDGAGNSVTVTSLDKPNAHLEEIVMSGWATAYATYFCGRGTNLQFQVIYNGNAATFTADRDQPGFEAPDFGR